MRKVIFGINLSLDGYFGHTGMLPDEDVHRYFTALLSHGSHILYGRVTYELMVPYWPDIAKSQSEDASSNEFALVFDSLEKVLFSKSLKQIEDKNTKLATGNLADEVTVLKQQTGKDILVGSLSIASQLSQLHLIDEYHFVIHPVIVGNGPKLFDTLKLQEGFQLDLLSSKTFKSGVIANHYKRHV
ncbi:dihydrofolate reductase family protein [Leptospira idonii]|uniref:Dihydrofolate reductase n=1 Tax=Leptospira idonii TaxID=1193500 RepID=A0A4R9M0H5_9LEPT|nr:dihydrofolate reductase family protein [Leptospira idonii]TGN18729.1 dihydrofolate reductase [Leptospira idonii]